MVRPSTRALITKVHLLLAAFTFPAILMFLVTGALYTWGITGENDETEHAIALSAPLEPAEQAVKALVVTELNKLGFAEPSGRTRLRGEGADWTFDWSGARSEVTVVPGETANSVKMTVKQPTFYRVFVQLHKAKGATLFRVYASFVAFTLFMLVATGLILSFAIPAFRTMTIWTSAIGAVAFVAAVMLG
jgi:hypothetical protein